MKNNFQSLDEALSNFKPIGFEDWNGMKQDTREVIRSVWESSRQEERERVRKVVKEWENGEEPVRIKDLLESLT